jgi:hypothetical protein
MMPITLALLLVAHAPVPTLSVDADLHGDGVPARVSAYVNHERRRGVLDVTRRDERWTSPPYAMWGLRAADLDGDGADEVLLGVWSRVRRHDEPEPHRTVWVLSWQGGALVERWRGSALARPLVDFTAGDVDADGRAELVALERSGDGCRLTAYRWTGFGFVGLAGAAVPCDTSLLDEAPLVRTGATTKTPFVSKKTLILREVSP